MRSSLPDPPKAVSSSSVSLVHVVGARPNFMKAAPVHRALQGAPWATQKLVHTGQHYDARMSDVFFDELGLPKPDRHLGVGSGSHAEQTGRVMMAFETVCLEEKPNAVIVYGDVNSTLACSLTAAKLGIPVVHVEAGLRSSNLAMPEEINRLVTDRLATLLLTPSIDADANLRAEGVAEERIVRVGNVMVDSLLHHLPQAKARATAKRLELPVDETGGRFGLLTLHRPANVDDPMVLRSWFEALDKALVTARHHEVEGATALPMVFPVHPRTTHRLDAAGIDQPRLKAMGVRQVDPLGYLDFLSLMSDARVVLTDSGGLQEETTALGIPCLTLRRETERPITLTEGTNRLIREPEELPNALLEVLSRPAVHDTKRRPELWDGHAAKRVVEAVRRRFL